MRQSLRSKHRISKLAPGWLWLKISLNKYLRAKTWSKMKDTHKLLSIKAYKLLEWKKAIHSEKVQLLITAILHLDLQFKQIMSIFSEYLCKTRISSICKEKPIFITDSLFKRKKIMNTPNIAHLLLNRIFKQMMNT